jgi:hypothetical protein
MKVARQPCGSAAKLDCLRRAPRFGAAQLPMFAPAGNAMGPLSFGTGLSLSGFHLNMITLL